MQLRPLVVQCITRPSVCSHMTITWAGTKPGGWCDLHKFLSSLQLMTRHILPLARMSIYPSVLFQVSFTWLNIGQSLQVTNTRYISRLWEKKCWRQYINTQEHCFQVELELCDKSTGPEITQQWLPVWRQPSIIFTSLVISNFVSLWENSSIS